MLHPSEPVSEPAMYRFSLTGGVMWFGYHLHKKMIKNAKMMFRVLLSIGTLRSFQSKTATKAVYMIRQVAFTPRKSFLVKVMSSSSAVRYES